jgi:hypothetical protein
MIWGLIAALGFAGLIVMGVRSFRAWLIERRSDDDWTD